MVDKLVALPPSVLTQATSQKRETLVLLAILAQFAFPQTYAGTGQLEMNLVTAFASVAHLSMQDIVSWLGSINAPISSLSSIVGDLQVLHDTLMQQNGVGTCQLLAVNRQDFLRVYINPTQVALLSQATTPCYLLRVGYSVDEGYGYYYLSLPGMDSVQTKLTWDSVIAAGISDGIAIAPPKPPVNLDAATNALHIVSQALLTAQNAHADAARALGLAE